MTDQPKEVAASDADAAEVLISCWKLWSTVYDQVAQGTGLTRSEVMTWMSLLQLKEILIQVTNQTKHVAFDPSCEKCQREKQLQERQLAMMGDVAKHLQEDHGDDEPWKKGEGPSE